ncbi:MAG: hypothetical protein WCK83_14775 [Burkholderiales bacterium]
MKLLPGPNAWLAGKGELAAKVKVHEPKVVVPVAVNPPLVNVAVGDVPVPENATVVAPEIATGAPAASTPTNPLLKVTGAAGVATATKAVVAVAAVAAVAATTVLEAATKVVVVVPPQATSTPAAISPDANNVLPEKNAVFSM